MNKYQQLTKQTIAVAVKAGVLVAIVGAIYFAASYYEDSVIKRKAEAESKFSQDDSLLTSLRSQMDKSGEAEKKFVELQGPRNTDDFSASFDVFQNFLKTTKDRYRISAELTLDKEIPTDKTELKNFAYDVLVTPHLVLSFKAISDVHVFSFIYDLQHNAPGLVRINKVEFKRSAATVDLTDDIVAKLRTGTSSLLVEGTIDFTWIRFAPKQTKPAAGTPAASTQPAP